MCTCRSAIWMLRAASGVAVVALLVFGPVGAVSDVPNRGCGRRKPGIRWRPACRGRQFPGATVRDDRPRRGGDLPGRRPPVVGGCGGRGTERGIWDQPVDHHRARGRVSSGSHGSIFLTSPGAPGPVVSPPAVPRRVCRGKCGCCKKRRRTTWIGPRPKRHRPAHRRQGRKVRFGCRCMPRRSGRMLSRSGRRPGSGGKKHKSRPRAAYLKMVRCSPSSRKAHTTGFGWGILDP